jgi:hypothetical protein
MELLLDTVAEEVSSIASAAGLNALMEQRDEFVEALASEVAVGIGTAESIVERVLLP